MADEESLYQFLAFDGNGRQKKGQVRARNDAQAHARAAGEGVTVVQLKRLPSGQAQSKNLASRREQIALLRQLAMMVEARVDVMQALDAMRIGAPSPAIRNAIQAASVDLRSGKPLGACLKTAIPGIPSNVLALINAGEAGGCLADTLHHAIQQLEAEERITSSIKSALIYPVFLSIAGLLAALIMLTFVIPRFASIVGDSRDQLDGLSQFIFMLGDLAQLTYGIVPVGLIIILVLFLTSSLSKQSPMLRHILTQHLPWLRTISLHRERERWCRIMAYALFARIAIVEAVHLASAGLGDLALRERSSAAVRELRLGARVSDATATIGLLDDTQISLVRAGEDSGGLAEMFRKIAVESEINLQENLKRATVVLEQTVIVAVAMFVGLIVYGLISSLTSVYETIGQ
jgi:general secretion pathway protein F